MTKGSELFDIYVTVIVKHIRFVVKYYNLDISIESIDGDLWTRKFPVFVYFNSKARFGCVNIPDLITMRVNNTIE